jgi:beta-phosphoglucomutase-like phosphatase (HAD superfamily)
MGLKIGLVTSGLYEKAYPEILDAFRTLGMGDPAEFYDAIITAGHALRKGQAGTLGELSPKPHPWLYAETFRVGLGMDYSERNGVIGIEDSGAGVVSIRLAGMQAWGVGGGNIDQSGTRGLCSHYANDLEGLLLRIRERAGA